jgi:hypothetical protein
LAAPAVLFALLAALGWWAIEPGLFTIDEPNHLAMVVSLRHGSLSPVGLEGLRPSRELAYFEPRFAQPAMAVPPHRLPPLYAFIAWPFSLLGVRGLFWLNLVATLGTCVLVFRLVRRHAARRGSAWLAVVAFGLGSYTLEYALGLWPHMLSALLCTAAVVLATTARERDAPRIAAAAGLVAGLAIGVRYPNVVYAAAVGLGLLLWAPRRWASALSFGAGALPPVAAIAWINDLRLGSANPVSKGGSYTRLGAGPGDGGPGLLRDAAEAFWFRVVDYSARPNGSFPGFVIEPDPRSGAYLWWDVVKKAWLQSSPWVALVLVACFLAFLPRSRGGRPGRAALLRSLALVIGAGVALFSLAGSARTDGTCFNQRYLLDVTPLAAVVLALHVDGLTLPRPAPLLAALAAGALSGGALAWRAIAALQPPESHLAIMHFPLALAALLLLARGLYDRTGPIARLAFAALLAASLTWAAAVHLGTDLRFTHARRALLAELWEQSRGRLPSGSAVLTWGQYRNVVVPLQLEQELLVVDAARDHGRTAAQLVQDLLRRGTRVFILTEGFDPRVRVALSERFGPVRIIRGPLGFAELAGTGDKR